MNSYSNSKNIIFKEYFDFLCKIKARNLLTLKKHQIPNHFLFADDQKNKIFETMKYLETNKKKWSQTVKKYKNIPLENFPAYNNHIISCFLLKEVLKLALVTLNENHNSIKIRLYDILTGQKITELDCKKEFDFEYITICGNNENLVVWTNNSLILLEILPNFSLKIEKNEKISELIYVKLLKNHSKKILIAQKDKNLKFYEIPSLKPLEDLFIFSFENSNFIFIDVFDNQNLILTLGYDHSLKICELLSSPKIFHEIKLKAIYQLKKAKLLVKDGKIEGALILTSKTIEFLSILDKNFRRVYAQSYDIEKIHDIDFLENSNFILAIENNFTSLHVKLIHTKDSFLSQSFHIGNIYPGNPFFQEKLLSNKNDEMKCFIYLDKHSILKHYFVDVSLQYSQLIKKIWTPEEMNFLNIETDLRISRNEGLLELIEAWKNVKSSNSFEEVYEIAENGKLYWNYKENKKIKTLFLELNKTKVFEKINDFSEEFHFSDLAAISAFEISHDKEFIAISELNSYIIKILQVSEEKNSVKLKYIMEFNYGQNLKNPYNDGFLFSIKNKKENLFLFHFFNDMKNLKNLGLVIWNIDENRLLKKLDFKEKAILKTLGYYEQEKELFCFFQSGKCINYNILKDEYEENYILSQKNGNFVLYFILNENQAITLSNDNLLRVLDLKKKLLSKIIYLSGEPISIMKYCKEKFYFHVIDYSSNYRIFTYLENNLCLEKLIVFEKKKYGDIYFFDVQKQKNDLCFACLCDESEILIFKSNQEKIIFKYSLKSEGAIKGVFWLNYPSKLLIVGEKFMKIIFVYWKWA